MPVWPAALLLAPPAIACAAPGQDACMARAGASLDALVRGDFAGAARDFSAGLAAALPAAKLRETWAQVTGMAGAYRSHGAPRRQTLRGQSVMVIPVVFAQRPLDFVTACDASGHLSAFYLLEPSVVDAPPPVVASTGADGVRVRPLDVPSPAGPLRGALTLPAGTGPFPAVVLVAGSGPHDMDETIGPNQPFLDLANRLARVGIASLRYDKHTFDYAPQTAANPDFTIDDEVTDDALTALHLLAQQQSIDPRRVFVLGHSLGAQMAPRIATRDAQPAGVIMLAAPARPFLDVIATQLRELGPRQGLSTAELDRREQAIAAERKLVVRCRSESAARGNVRAVAGELSSLSQVYLLSLHDVHQLATAKVLALPLLILQGGNDFQVLPTRDFDAWKKALASHRNVTLHLFPGLSHLFMPGPTKSPADYARPAHVDPWVITTIADWIKAQPAR